MPKPVHVLIAVPNTGNLEPGTEQSLREMMAATRRVDRLDLELSFGTPVHVVRHRLVNHFLSIRAATHLLFIDSDMGLPPDTLDRLLSLDVPIGCLPCPMFEGYKPPVTGDLPPTPNVWTNIWMLESPPQTPSKEQIVRFLMPDEFPPEPFECFATGLACCLIRREVVEKMDFPMFEFISTDDYDAVRVGEDAFFFEKARDLGYRVIVDPGAICDHFKVIDLTHMEDFFLDEPISWKWNEGRRSGRAEPVFCACIAGSSPVHSKTARYLISQSSRPGFISKTFGADDWSQALRDAVRTFLRQSKQRWMLILDSLTCPPDDFIDQCLASPHPCSAGLVREMVSGIPKYAAATKNSSGVLQRIEGIDFASPAPLEVDAVSLRAVLIDRELLAPLGSSWIPPETTPYRAGIALAETLGRRNLPRIRLVPIGCQHYGTIGLLSLLETKLQLRARLRKANNAPVPE